ncbi:hypothetical protein IFR05_012063 [Cadophora sp. M221]|nr:hypothetical protein IFR05_012063 [Cadophora sp. M221]
MDSKPEVSELDAQQQIRLQNTISSDMNHVPSHGDYKIGLDAVQEENAVGYHQYQEGLHLEFTEKENKRVRWKIDLIILPIFLITQALQFMDKTALNYANLFGYKQALNLKGQEFNYLSAMVYAGYFFGQYPCGWLIGRFPAQKIIAISCLLWGATVLIMTQCRTYQSALAVRFLMGVFEAAVTPGLTLMTGFWYTRREIPLRQCIWFSSLGWGGIIGSYISMGISKLPGDMTPERWELIFFILGGATCLWAFRIIAVKRVAGNETGIKNKEFVMKQAIVAFWDPKALLIFTSVFAAKCNPKWRRQFIQHNHHSRSRILHNQNNRAQIRRRRRPNHRPPHRRYHNPQRAKLPSPDGNSSQHPLHHLRSLDGVPPRSNTWGRLVCFWLVNAQSVGFTVSLTTVSSNMAGYTHRSMASAMIFTAYFWGNFAGPFVVKASEAPNYPTAIAGLLAGYSIKLGCHLALLGYMFFMNRYRDRKYGPANKESSNEAGMQDKTEFENKDFRYVL